MKDKTDMPALTVPSGRFRVLAPPPGAASIQSLTVLIIHPSTFKFASII